MYSFFCNIFITDIITKIPEVRDVLQLLAPIASRWYEIGISLGISDNDLERLLASNMSNIAKLSRIISIWQNSCVSPTWAALIAAIEGPIVGNIATAHEIRRYLHESKVYEKYVNY